MGLAVPEKDGGLGLGTLDLALVLEEMGRVAAPGPFLPTQLVIAALLRAGTAALVVAGIASRQFRYFPSVGVKALIGTAVGLVLVFLS